MSDDITRDTPSPAILRDANSIQAFLERWDSGDPLKDWYEEGEIADALAEAIIRVAAHKEGSA